jgi:hypothetical protein
MAGYVNNPEATGEAKIFGDLSRQARLERP